MADGKPRFHWWYLLLLLPVALSVGAHWYVGHRLDRAITQANEGDNSLTVSSFSYGFFPIHFTADRISFDQRRESFAAAGRLRSLEVRGVNLLSLLRRDPIEINSLSLTGLDASLTRRAPASPRRGDSAPLRLSIAQVALDRTFLVVQDAPKRQMARVANLRLRLRSLHLPLRPTTLHGLELAADSSSFRDQGNDLFVNTKDIAYDTTTASVRINKVSITRDTSVAVDMQALTVSGLNAEDLRDEITIDSIRVAGLGGRARVQGNTGGSSSAGPFAGLRVGKLSLLDADLTVSGDFGTATFDGRIQVGGIRYHDSLALDDLEVEGREITFSDPGNLRLTAQGAVIRQGGLHFPLRPGETGATTLEIPEFRLHTGSQSVSGDALRYASAEQNLRVEELTFTGSPVSGRLGALHLGGIDRAAFLAGKPLTAGRAELDALDLRIATGDGGSYAIAVPRVQLDELSLREGLQIDRSQVENAEVRRRGADGKEDIVAEGVYLDQYGLRTPIRPAALGPVNVRIRRVRTVGDEKPVDHHYHRIAYRSRPGVLTVDSLRRVNRYTPNELFRREIAKSWLDFGFDGIRVQGIDHQELLSGEVLRMDSLSAAAFRVRVVENLSMEISQRRKQMPLEALRAIGPRIVVRAARCSATDITYGVVDSLREPKTIHLNEGTVWLTGLDTKVSTTDSVYASYDATFEGTTPMRAVFVLARDPSGRNFAVRGELGAYDLSRVNPLMEVAAGAIIETGQIDRMRYDGLFADGVMTGDMHLYYRQLDLKVVGSGAWIKNLLSGVVVKEENVEGEDFRPGKMYHEHDPHKSFFNAYWKGLVSGMRSSALSDIVLQEELD